MSDCEQTPSNLGMAQLVHSTKDPPTYDCHLLFRQQLCVQEDLQITHWVCLGWCNPILHQKWYSPKIDKSQNPEPLSLARVQLKPVVPIETFTASRHRIRHWWLCLIFQEQIYIIGYHQHYDDTSFPGDG